MQIIKSGVTRTVILTKNKAFKFPCIHYKYKNFLQGLLANLQEVNFHNIDDKLCPVIFSLPLGFLVVMPKCKPLTNIEYNQLIYKDFIQVTDGVIPVENKIDSFGWLNEKIVAIDYGN